MLDEAREASREQRTPVLPLRDPAFLATAEFVGWMNLVARDAAMTVYHFGSTLDALKGNVGKAQSLAAVNSEALKIAWKRFESSFPFHEVFRHAVGHLADNMRTPEKLADMWPEQGPLLVGTLGPGAAYIMRQKDNKGRDREMILTVTDDTLAKLQSIKRQTWEAFRPVSIWQ
jgi:hypothetical protein